VVFVAFVVTGWLCMNMHGWGLGHAPWLSVKIGFVLFLFTPLEGFQAYVAHVFSPRARRLTGPVRTRQVERADDLLAIIRTMATVLYPIAVPLCFWLAVYRPS
jgi:hypothetical protein